MGFMMTGLGPQDQGIIAQLQPEIVQTLRKASDRVRTGMADGECQKWFGDTSPNWKAALQRDLNQLASVINTTTINISFEKLKTRDSGTNAAASRPKNKTNNESKWANYTNLTQANNQSFRISLDLAWNTQPLYRPFKRPAQSKFQILVHETTHLVLNTEDHAYLPPAAEMLAASQPARAQDNAENWGFFVEEFR